MKEKTCLIVVLALGLALMAGCGGGGGNDVPRSSASYMGSSIPAVLDSTTNTQALGVNFLWDVGQVAGRLGGGRGPVPLGSTTSNTQDSVEGGDGGFLDYSGSYSESWSETSFSTETVQSLSFNDFADSGGVSISYVEGPGGIDKVIATGLQATPLLVRPGFFYQNLQAGRGSLYRSTSFSITSDGIAIAEQSTQPQPLGPVKPGLVGAPLNDSSASYSNFNSFYTSEGYPYAGSISEQRQMLQTGYTSTNMSGAYDSTIGYWSFEDVLSANYAVDYFYSYDDGKGNANSFHYTQALLSFGQNHSWDLSTVTLTSSGTYCGEGELESYAIGCLDFDVSLAWDREAPDNPAYCRGASNILACYAQPESGLITLQADGATASYAFTPGGGMFTFDAGDGSAVFQTDLAPIVDR